MMSVISQPPKKTKATYSYKTIQTTTEILALYGPAEVEDKKTPISQMQQLNNVGMKTYNIT